MATYYFDFVGGADSNAGTKVSPWKHHKYMAGATSNAAAMTHAAGDQYIFKGGVTWDSTCFTMSIAASGSAGAGNDYYGVDLTWYTGGSFTKPLFDLAYTTGIGIHFNSNSYITIDNIEVAHSQAPSDATYALMHGDTCSNLLIQNCYIHGWRITGDIDGAHGGISFGAFSAGTASIIIDHTEIENSENVSATTLGASITTTTPAGGAKTFTVTGALSVSAGQHIGVTSNSDTASYMFGTVTSFSAGSLVMNVVTANGTSHSDWTIEGPLTANGVCCHYVGIIRNGSKIHDNSSAILYCIDFGGLEGPNNAPSELYNITGIGFDGIYHYNGIYLDPTTMNFSQGYIRNCYLHDVYRGTNMAYPNVRAGANITMYNCVLYGAMSAQLAVEIDPYQYASEGSGSFTAYNNTIYNFSSGAPAFNVVDRGTSQKVGTLTLFNNHVINANALTNQSASTVTTYVNGTNLSQSTATAASQGYVLGNLYAPTSAGNSTVGAGTDESGTFTTDILGILRSVPWDIGAYQFFAGGGATLAIKRLGRYLRLRGPSA